MLGSLIYILILLAIILAGGFALNFLVQSDGLLVLHYGDRLYEVTLFEAAILLILLILAIYIAVAILRLIIALIRFIAGDETAFGHFFVRSRERRGLRALSDAYLALAAGDSKKAEKRAKKAELTLRHPELTRIVNAQAAELAGDTDRARTYYRALLEDPRTAFVGTRGLLHIALQRGDNERALKLAEYAHGLRPKDRETMETLYMLQSQAFDWAAARRTLAAQAKAGYLPVAEGRRRDAALALAQSEDATALGDAEQARGLAAEAAELDPTNTAAVTTAAKLLLNAGNKRQATKLIVSAWRAQPKPQLAAAFAAIEPDEAPAARRRRFEALFSTHPDNPETHFLRAELALVERDWNGAEAAIQRLRETEPSARSCAIMAAIARGRGEPDQVVRAWLARALGAPRDADSEVFISHSAMLPLLVEPDQMPEGKNGADRAENADSPVNPEPVTPESAMPETAAEGTPTAPASDASETSDGDELDEAELEEITPPRRDFEGADDSTVASTRAGKPAA